MHSAWFTTVQVLTYYLHVRNDSHPLGPLHLTAVGCLTCYDTMPDLLLYSAYCFTCMYALFLIRSVLSISKRRSLPNVLLYQCLIYYLHVHNVPHPLGPLLLKAIAIAYCTVPNLLLYSAWFTSVQLLIYYLHVRNVPHPLGSFHLKAIVIA
jgi:hypothetical protein